MRLRKSEIGQVQTRKAEKAVLIRMQREQTFDLGLTTKTETAETAGTMDVSTFIRVSVVACPGLCMPVSTW